ncbi:MAG: TlpA disulfide reductase family protein [Terriglobia bacterium]
MTKNTKAVVLIAAIVLIAAASGLLSRRGAQPAIAQTAPAVAHPMAPAFTLTDISGQPLSLNQYRGKVTLLNFWATWCGFCREEIPDLIRLQKIYGSQGLQIVGISEDSDGAAPVRDFYKRMGMNYPVALDNGKTGELYGGIFSLPTTFLIGRDGRVYGKVPAAVSAAYFEQGIKTLLAASPGAEVKDFHPLPGSETAEVETPAQANSVVPGIDVTKLSKAELAQYEELLSQQECSCGCKVSVLHCRQADPGCATSREMAQKALRELKRPAI